MSESSSGVTKVREHIAIVAGVRAWGQTRESWLARVSKEVPTVSFRTVRAIFYGEIRDATHWAARDIKRRADELSAARNETSAAAARFASLSTGMANADEAFFSAEIDRIQHLLDELRGKVSPGNKGQL